MRGMDARYALLRAIASPADLRRLPVTRLPALARELRSYLLERAASRDGIPHAAAESAELALAVHYAFETPNERVVWDGSHHAYAHRVITLVNMRFVKPLDQEMLDYVATSHQALVTIEDNAIAGGAGSAVAEALAARGLCLPLLRLGIPDRFIANESRMGCLEKTRLDPQGLSERIERWWSLHAPRRVSRVAGA